MAEDSDIKKIDGDDSFEKIIRRLIRENKEQLDKLAGEYTNGSQTEGESGGN